MNSVLVAEDRATSRELIRTVLEHCGYAVIEAANGQEAITLACEKQPDLLLLDLQMPIKNGFETGTELRSDERFRSTPIVVLTAGAMNGDRERALQDASIASIQRRTNLLGNLAEMFFQSCPAT